jgi:DNA-binding response OmpR family regulator
LGLTDFEIQTAEDGELRPEVIKADLPDLVFLDLMMPGLDGSETLERKNSSRATKGCEPSMTI